MRAFGGESPVLVGLSIVAGITYLAAPMFGADGAAALVWKGLPVGLLALAAALAARSRDGGLLALVLALGAAGDVLLEIEFMAGVAAFAAGHVAAILLYLRNRRRPIPMVHVLIAALIALSGLVMPAFVLPPGHPELVSLTGYSALLTLMAGAAWLSRFPHGLTGLGALLFVASDTLIAVRMAQPASSAGFGSAIWLLYYFGQLLIFAGARAGLKRHSSTSFSSSV